MHSHSETLASPVAQARAACIVTFVALLVGCASTPPGDRVAVTGAAEMETQAPRERASGDVAEIAAVEGGFTITEQLRISGEARTDYELAMQLLAQNRVEEGIDQLHRVIEQAPDVTAPYIDLGIAYGKAGDLEAAEEALLQAIDLTPEHPIAHNELGIVYRRMGRFAEARESYERALEVQPAFHFARRNLAVLCDLYLGDAACALEHYQAYLQAVVEDDEVEIWVADLIARSSP